MPGSDPLADPNVQASPADATSAPVSLARDWVMVMESPMGKMKRVGVGADGRTRPRLFRRVA